MITSLNDFISLFPAVDQSGSEWKSPCPFCTDGELSTKNGVEFRGKDRFVWWQSENRFFCRRCKTHGRGRGESGVYTPEDLAFRLRVEISATLATAEPGERIEKPLKMLWTDRQVDAAHRRVDRAFWYRYGWDDATIDHFRLGQGVVYTDDGEVNTIPMRLQKPFQSPIDGYVIATRAIGQGGKKHTPGSLHNYLWLIERYPDDKTIVVAEGEKDAISVSLLGWNVATTLVGASVWSNERTQFLKALGYERVLVFGDNDEPGQTLNRMVAESCHRFGIPVETLDWGEADDASPGEDTTDVLTRLGKDAARTYIENLLVEPLRHVRSLRGTAIDDYTLIDRSYIPDLSGIQITPLEEVRGTGPMSIYRAARDFLDTYEDRAKRGHGKLKIFAAGPGAGKTHTLVRVAEEEARKNHEVRLIALAELQNAIAATEAALADAEGDEETTEVLAKELKKYRQKLDEFSFSTISWFGQYKEGWNDLMAAGADESLWYNFEARNHENCRDFDTVTQLGQRHHDVGTYCKLGCPFREACRETGYLAQEAESRQYPIVFYRHQHLRMREAITRKKLVVIDENPSGLVDSEPLRFRSKDVLTANPGWDVEPEDREMVDRILMFAKAVASTMQLHTDVPMSLPDGAVNPDYTLFGNRLFAEIDVQVRTISQGEYTLVTLMDGIDAKMLADLYQPTYVGGDKQTRILHRCVPQLFRAMQLEMPDYEADPKADRSSLIFLVGSIMEVYATDKIRVSYRTPILLADATAFIPDLYAAMFSREIDQIYAPVIRNPNAQIVVVTGSDWTLSQIRSQIGPQLQERAKAVTKVTALTGEEVDLSDIPLGDELYQAKVVRDALDLIKGLAERHTSLMVVTHKTWREPLETTIKGVYPDLNVAFGHFGALRGTNLYKDFEAIALIGMFRIPYDVIYRRAQVWMRHIDPVRQERIDPETIVRIKPYHGQKEAHGYRTFDHWLADALVCLVEEGEMIQCIERIRPHASSNHKYVYVMANRPFARFINGFVTKKDLLDLFTNTKHRAIYEEVKREMVKGLKPPSRRELARRYHVSPREVAKIFERAEGEIQSQLGIIPLEIVS